MCVRLQPGCVRLQPVCTGLQPVVHGVAASGSYGCSSSEPTSCAETSSARATAEAAAAEEADVRPAAACALMFLTEIEKCMPAWSNAVKSAALEAASSSTRGSGWAPSGPASS